MSLIQVTNLSVNFRMQDKEVEAVKNISFSIEKGETIALVGESGTGKSVSAYSILQLLPYPQAYHPSGSILFEGKELVGIGERKMRQIRGDRIAMIFQEPMTSLNPLHTIGKQVSETLILHKGYSKEKARQRVVELLEKVQIRNARERLEAYPHELSGGERQRVMIAMALANDPDLLIADEPTTALDVTIQAQILSLLAELKRETGMALLLITHDLTIVRKIADRVYIMSQGEIVEEGDVHKIFSNPGHPYSIKLIHSEPHGTANPSTIRDEKILTAEDIKVYFPKEKHYFLPSKNFIKAVDGVSLEIRKGETLGIVGESGSGKTTLGFAILRLIKSKGKIIYAGKNIQDKKSGELRSLRKELQVVFQDPFGSLNPRFTIEMILSEGLDVHKIALNPEERNKIISDILLEVGLDPQIKERYPHEFSGGQRQRISIARAMILKPNLVILDEPTSSLDLTVQAQIIELLRNLQEKHGISYIFISHDLRVVKAMSHRILVLKNGKVVEEGSTDQIFKEPKTEYTKDLMEAAFG